MSELFGSRLKQLRLEKNLSQRHVAEILNYGYTAVSNYEKGINEPSLKDLARIADFFDVSVDYLIGREPVDVRGQYLALAEKIGRLKNEMLETCGQMEQMMDEVRKILHPVSKSGSDVEK